MVKRVNLKELNLSKFGSNFFAAFVVMISICIMMLSVLAIWQAAGYWAGLGALSFVVSVWIGVIYAVSKE
jgi:hypothetical protein